MNTKTFLAVIAAMLAAATVPCFAKGNVVTQWKWNAHDGSGTITLTFYSDNIVEVCDFDKYDILYNKFEATYSGDTTKDGKISIEGEFGALIGEIVGNALELKDDSESVVFVKVK